MRTTFITLLLCCLSLLCISCESEVDLGFPKTISFPKEGGQQYFQQLQVPVCFLWQPVEHGGQVWIASSCNHGRRKPAVLNIATACNRLSIWKQIWKEARFHLFFRLCVSLYQNNHYLCALLLMRYGHGRYNCKTETEAHSLWNDELCVNMIYVFLTILIILN